MPNLVYNDLILHVLSAFLYGVCLSNLFLKWKDYLAICEIMANDDSIMI